MARRIRPFQRKLQALDYHLADNINVKDSQDLKMLVVWLEDQKIRHYKIGDREDLHNHSGEAWKRTFKRYLNELECPFNLDSQLMSVLDWLLGVAIRYEYGDISKTHPELRCALASESTKQPLSALSHSSKSALNIDSSDAIFMTGVKALARIVQVTEHPDISVLLEAVRIVIEEKLSVKKCENGVERKRAKQFAVSARDCGFELGDPMRLLHIQELRDLQTRINEVIVEVQAITANPKTDQSLGRVGK